jgi:hypothetical protein
MTDYEHWLEDLKHNLQKRTGRSDIEVTGGPYRAYDVRVSHKDCHPLVDFYSAMRWDSGRVRAALDYAVSMVRDWEATLAAREREMQVVRPHFERLQVMFPGIELHYTVQYGETHFVRAEKKQGRIIVNFDLWPAMKEKDIERLAEYIKEYTEKMAEAANTALAGADYW